jgi:hypothetical protein
MTDSTAKPIICARCHKPVGAMQPIYWIEGFIKPFCEPCYGFETGTTIRSRIEAEKRFPNIQPDYPSDTAA